MNTISKLLIATAFSAGVAAAVTGASASGQSEAIDNATNCAAVHWPMIPAECLENAPVREVRYATANSGSAGPNLQARFEIAFQ